MAVVSQSLRGSSNGPLGFSLRFVGLTVKASASQGLLTQIKGYGSDSRFYGTGALLGNNQIKDKERMHKKMKINRMKLYEM